MTITRIAYIINTENEKGRERKETMVKVYGLNELAEIFEEEERIRKAEKEIKKENVKRLEAEGVDKEIAKVMTDVFTEYNL